MSKRIRMTYCGMEGEGRTVTEAKQDAGRKIERVLSGDYNPRFVCWRGLAALVTRDLHGWGYKIVCAPEDAREGHKLAALTLPPDRSAATYTPFIVWMSGRYAKVDEAIEAATNDLAQQAWQPEDGTAAPSCLTDQQAREFKSWAEFQLRYIAGKRRGLSDDDAHSYAGRNPARADLWAGEDINPPGWQSVDGVALPPVASWAEGKEGQ